MFLKKIQVALARAAFCFLAAVVGFLMCQACAAETTASGDETIRLWDLASGKEIHRGSDGSQIWVEAISASQDGKVASAGQDNTIAVWDAATGKLIRRIAGSPLVLSPVLCTTTRG